MTFRDLALAAVILLLQISPIAAQAPDPIVALRERAGPSVVRVVVRGTTPVGREMMMEGSGVILRSQKDVSVVVTTAHVLGRAGTWRSTDNGEPDRTIQIWVPDDNGRLAVIVPPVIASRNDSQVFQFCYCADAIRDSRSATRCSLRKVRER